MQAVFLALKKISCYKNSREFIGARTCLGSVNGGIFWLAMLFAKITLLFKVITSVPWRSGAWKLNLMFSVFVRSEMLKMKVFLSSENQPFFTIKGFSLARIAEFFASARYMFGIDRSKVPFCEYDILPGDSFSRKSSSSLSFRSKR